MTKAVDSSRIVLALLLVVSLFYTLNPTVYASIPKETIELSSTMLESVYQNDFEYAAVDNYYNYSIVWDIHNANYTETEDTCEAIFTFLMATYQSGEYFKVTWLPDGDKTLEFGKMQAAGPAAPDYVYTGEFDVVGCGWDGNTMTVYVNGQRKYMTADVFANNISHYAAYSNTTAPLGITTVTIQSYSSNVNVYTYLGITLVSVVSVAIVLKIFKRT